MPFLKSTWPNSPSLAKLYVKQGICQNVSVVTINFFRKMYRWRTETQSLDHLDFHRLTLLFSSHCYLFSTMCSGAEFSSMFRVFKCLVVAKCLYKYIYIQYIYNGLSLWRLYFYTNPFLDMNKNLDMRTLYILKQGYRQKCRCCLKWYLGVQLLLCICVFSDVSRSFCSTQNNPWGRTAIAPGVWCICLFMWKMFYVLFIPSGNDIDDDDSWLNDRTLINLSPKSRWSSILFGWFTK